MASDKGKRILIHLSSSSDDDDNGGDYEHICSSSSSSGDECYSIDDQDGEENDDDDDEEIDNGGGGIGDDDDDEDALYNRVIHYLQENSDLRGLTLKACKAYLRRHGLRVSGNKDVCLNRVQEHWRIKDGQVEVLYPRSSFVINCTGDVCKGDVVLFTQKVEVLWSKGIQQLPLLFPLLVKGRNLYRLKTYRLPWKSELERSKVLAEKHRRGTLARLKRGKRQKAWSTDKGGKRRKVSHSTRQSQMSYSKRGKCVDRGQKASSSKHLTINSNKEGAGSHTVRARYIPEYSASALQSNNDASRKCPNSLGGCHNRSMQFVSPPADFQRVIAYRDPTMVPVQQYNRFNCRPVFHNSYSIPSPLMTHAESWRSFPSRTVPVHRQNGLLRCSVQGCRDSGSDRCVIAACWRCCRREGMRCYVHG